VSRQDEEPPSPPPRDSCFVVFAQPDSVRVDIGGWDRHAARFFKTRLGLTEEAQTAEGPLGFVVSPEGEAPGIRLAFARRREAEDLVLAEAADAAGSGLALLARRCPMVWLVARESAEDRLALRLATILASVLLGPILDARVPELLGVKSARARIERS
jgi:hypothetical protein